jgi:AcrR family transcriptional regulator
VATTTRTELSRDRIVAAAMKLLDEQGRRALSMRALATRLGVGTMSLYHYVADRDDLLDGLADLLDAGLPDRVDTSGWRAALRSVAIEWRRAALAHPAAAALVLEREPGPRRTAAAVAVVEALVLDGFSDDDAVSAFRSVAFYVVGVCIAETNRSEEQRRVLDPDGGDRVFLFGLDALLDGLDAHRR